MTTNFDYNQLQQWSNSDLIEQILLLQDFINKESQWNTITIKILNKQTYTLYKQNTATTG